MTTNILKGKKLDRAIDKLYGEVFFGIPVNIMDLSEIHATAVDAYTKTVSGGHDWALGQARTVLKLLTERYLLANRAAPAQ